MYGNDLSSRSRTLNGGPVPLDEVLLEVQRLGLALRDDHLDPMHPLHELVDAGARVAAAVEVAAHAGPERLRLADVEDLVALVAKEVDARARRQPTAAGPERNLHARELAYPHLAAPPRHTSRLHRSPPLALALPAHAGGPEMTLGAAEDAVRAPDLVTTKDEDVPAPARGLHGRPGDVQLAAGARRADRARAGVLRNIEAAARLSGVKVYVSVYHPGSRTTPLDADRPGASSRSTRRRSRRPARPSTTSSSATSRT